MSLLGTSPDVFAVDEGQQAEVDHVPGAVVIAHEVQSHGHMRVTVITTQIVLQTQQNSVRYKCGK